jgi:hypothetical protein
MLQSLKPSGCKFLYMEGDCLMAQSASRIRIVIDELSYPILRARFIRAGWRVCVAEVFAAAMAQNEEPDTDAIVLCSVQAGLIAGFGRISERIIYIPKQPLLEREINA